MHQDPVSLKEMYILKATVLISIWCLIHSTMIVTVLMDWPRPKQAHPQKTSNSHGSRPEAPFSTTKKCSLAHGRDPIRNRALVVDSLGVETLLGTLYSLLLNSRGRVDKWFWWIGAGSRETLAIRGEADRWVRQSTLHPIFTAW
jgi:hypothetical protein